MVLAEEQQTPCLGQSSHPHDLRYRLQPVKSVRNVLISNFDRNGCVHAYLDSDILLVHDYRSRAG